MSKVRLITGSASGLGRNIAEAVLASGDRLVATARDPGRNDVTEGALRFLDAMVARSRTAGDAASGTASGAGVGFSGDDEEFSAKFNEERFGVVQAVFQRVS
jgi:NAD(P)-dependent dehydrogenase (short-subunit alcohol dehydrogenase family)